MLTPLGKELRKLRVDRGHRLIDMGQLLGVSASFISAVEVGRKAPPSDFVASIVKAYKLTGKLAADLAALGDAARKSFVVEPQNSLAHDTAGMFARRINELSPEQLEQINRILGGDK